MDTEPTVLRLGEVENVAQDQTSGKGDVALIHQVVKDGVELAKETLQQGSYELKQLYRMKDSMRLTSKGVLEVRFIENGREKWRVVCPESYRSKLIWQTHGLAHSGTNRTLQ